MVMEKHVMFMHTMTLSNQLAALLGLGGCDHAKAPQSASATSASTPSGMRRRELQAPLSMRPASGLPDLPGIRCFGGRCNGAWPGRLRP